MSREAKVARNSAILALQHIAINIITIFIVGFIARKLGKQDYGIYSLAFAFPAIFEFIGSLGLRPLMIREIARDKEHSHDYLSKVIPARIILIFLMAASVLVSAALINYELKIVYAIAIAVCSSILEQLSRIILDVFQAFEEMGKVAFRDIAVRVFTAVASASVLLLGFGLYTVCSVYLAGSLLGLIINVWLYSRRFEFPIMKFDYHFIRNSIKEGSSYILIGFASALYPKIDVLLLSKMTDNVSLGTYNAASNLFYRLNFMSDAVATAVFPALSQLYWSKREEADTIFNRSLIIVIIVSLPVAIGGAIISKQIINFIYGSSYDDSAKVFSVLICTVPFMFVSTLLNYSLGAIRKQKFVAKVLIFNVIIGVALNAFFIHKMGYLGAAIATLITHIIAFLFFVYGIKDNFKVKVTVKSLVKILLSLFILSLVTYITIPFGIYVTLPLAAAVYFVCLKLLGLTDRINFNC